MLVYDSSFEFYSHPPIYVFTNTSSCVFFFLDISKLKEDHEKEVLLLKAKLTKAEAQAHINEQKFSAEQKQNAELMSICDELLKKLEQQKQQK